MTTQTTGTGGKRRAISTPGARREGPRRSTSGIVLSVVVHVALVVVLARIIVVAPYDWSVLLGSKQKPVTVERIGFLALPRDAAPRETPRSGGDNRPARNVPVVAPPPIVAPREVPSAISEPSRKPAAVDSGGSGAVVGSGGATAGIRPSFSDPRIWAPPAPLVVAPMSPRKRLDSALTAIVQAINDSTSALPVGREPGDWTVTRGGKKYGIDGKLIHLGNFSLPTALLALLPLNQTGNPTALERDRRLSAMRSEIQSQAARAQRDDDFRAAVKALRERKEKERQDQKKGAADPPVPVPIPVPPQP